MSVALNVSTATFPDIAAGAILPKRDFLVGEYLFGGSMASTIKNRANPLLPMVEVGVITALNRVSNGSGGTDGTYALIFSGGNPTTPATGTFTVTGGTITAVTLSTNGGYQSAPTVLLTNCPGLTGASVTATRASPTYNSASVLVRSSTTAGYGFQTGIIPDENHSLILVRKPATTASTVTIAGMPAVGSSLWGFRQFGGSTNYFSGGEGSSPNQGANRPTPSAGTIFFECGVEYVHGNSLLYYGSGGAISVATAPTTAVLRRTLGSGASTVDLFSQMCYGSGLLTDSITTNNEELYFGAIYNTQLTSAEVTAAYLAVQAFLATLGVTVV